MIDLDKTTIAWRSANGYEKHPRVRGNRDGTTTVIDNYMGDDEVRRTAINHHLDDPPVPAWLDDTPVHHHRMDKLCMVIAAAKDAGQIADTDLKARATELVRDMFDLLGMTEEQA